jgi:hypothetical protein
MSQIPAPLLSRHLAVAVVVAALLGVAAAALTILVPIDRSVLGLVVVRQIVLALQLVIVALAVFVVWRTLARRTRAAAVAGLAATAGLLLFAVVQVATILVDTDWGVRPIVIALELAALLAALLFVPALFVLGAAVIRNRVWRGPTRATLIVIAVLVIPIGVAQVMHLPLAFPYGVWSLSFLGLAVGLRARRQVPVSSQPAAQQGAARV